MQDKNQLMRRENELDILTAALAKARNAIQNHDENDAMTTEMVRRLERDIERLSSFIDDSACHANEVISLRRDRQTLQSTQESLEHERSKCAVLNEVLATLQERHTQLQDSQNRTIQELDVASKSAEMMQEALDKRDAENALMSRQIAFSAEQSDFYSAEIEEKLRALEAGLVTVTEMVTGACRECWVVPELRSSRRFAQETEALLRTTEQSLASERAWSRDKGADLKRLEDNFVEMENKFAEQSLATGKLEKELSECSLRVLALHEERDHLNDKMSTSSQHVVLAEGRITEAEFLQGTISSTLSEVCSGISRLKLAHDERLKDLHDRNARLTISLADATSRNGEHQQAQAELGVKLERLAADLEQKERLVSVLQGQLESMQTLAVGNAAETSQLRESVRSLHQLQGRIAQTETELDRFQKSHVTLQAENTRLRRESLQATEQIESSLSALDEAMMLLSSTLTKGWEGGSTALEHLRQELLRTSDVRTHAGSGSCLQSQVHHVIEELRLSWQESEQLNDALRASQCSLATEREALSATGEALAHERHTIAVIQKDLRDLRNDIEGKQRYINYLEEQQTSLHSTMLARELENANQAKTKKEQETAVRKRAIMRRISSLCASKCLNVWHERSREEVRKRAVLKRASQKISGASVANVLANWWDVVRECKEERAKEAAERQQEMQSAKLLEAKIELSSAGDLRKELLGKEQLVRMLEKKVESFQIQVLHQEVGEAEAANLKQELHIATLEVTEQKLFLEEYQHQASFQQSAAAVHRSYLHCCLVLAHPALRRARARCVGSHVKRIGTYPFNPSLAESTPAGGACKQGEPHC